MKNKERQKSLENKETKEGAKRPQSARTSGFERSMPIILTALAVYLALSFMIEDLGVMGSFLRRTMLGLFSYGAYATPVFLLCHAVFYTSDRERGRVLSRVIFSLGALLAISVTVYTAENWRMDTAFEGAEYFALGKSGIGGGLIGSSVAYALIKLFDYVGVIIIACSILAIYVTYFFSTGAKRLKSLGYSILKGTVITLAAIERWIKRIFTKKQKSDKKGSDVPEKKSRKNKMKKTAKGDERRREKLFEDDFFAVDNGIESLEISELGIKEQRSRKSIEARPTLHDKVHRKSDVTGDDLATSVSHGEASSDDYFETVDYTERVRADIADIIVEEPKREPQRDNKKAIFNPIELERTTHQTANDTPVQVSDSADAVFTESFDPFLASRERESRRKDSSATVRESLSEITEEDVERARRNAQFEARKAMLIREREAERRSAQTVNTRPETPYTNPTVNTRPETPYTNPTVNTRPETPYTNPTVNTRPETPYTNPTVNTRPENPYTNPTVCTEDTERPVQKTVEYHTPEASSPYIEEEEATSLTLDKSHEQRRDEGYTESGTETVLERRFSPSPAVSEDAPVICDEPVSYFTTERDEIDTPECDDGKKTSLVFEFDGEIAELTEADDEVSVLEIERTRLTSSQDDTTDDGYSDEEEVVTSLPPEDEPISEEEIPPEEQNPAISGFRDMFSIFRDEKEESADEEDTEDEPIRDVQDGEIPFEEDVEEEDEEEELDLPFERPTRPVTPERAPVSEKTAPAPQKKQDYKNYKFPPLELLALGKPQNDDEINVEINQNTMTLIETLASFNVTASIKGVDRGPRITRYEVVPARGVKVQAITNLFDDIALNLAAEGIRMEAPIPGKSAIGFEIPNKNPTNVTLRELLECEEFVNAKSKTFVCIGKDVAGNPVFGDIGKFPHALVAGATGMGKSVCINSIMISMLYKARPDEVKFIMIDPKKVEFRMYSGIPHLLIPVITEAKQAAGALMWAVEEMERRYSIIEQLNIRNIESYNERCAIDKSIGEPMPKIVIVIDELNDLMMQVRDPVEDLIMRIAQKARAAGIHLIIGTQRPDVKVVTGTIKANINTRISCKVTSVQDSRTILEMAGAEKLLNRGDMLFKPVDKPKPIRVQGCFVSDPEVEAIMSFLKEGLDGNIYDDEVFAEINRAAQKCGNKKNQGQDDDMGDDGGEVGYYSDQQFLDAVELAIRSGKVSTSLLQRKLSIGYGKAAKFIDAMEDIGIVSEQNGQKPRDVLLSLDEWHEKLTRVNFDD